jgi:hypothetical protein
MAQAATYRGPSCPRCSAPLPDAWLKNGEIICPECAGEFEATLFNPVEPKKAEVVRVVEDAPEGANVCANHARNAAVTSCQRCGLFICSLCDMNVGAGSMCPSCFSRLHTEGALSSAARRYRDYTRIARSAVILGFIAAFMLFSIPCGALAMYYARKGYKQRRELAKPVAGPVILMVLGAVEVLGGLGVVAFFIYAAFK